MQTINKNLLWITRAGLVFFIALSLLMTTTVFAQDTSTSVSGSVDVKASVDTNTTDSPDDSDEKRPVRPSNIPTRTKANIQNLRASTTDRVTDVRENLQDRAEELREDREEKRDVRRAELSEKRKDRIRAYMERMLKRFRAAIARLSKLADRIESRIVKLEERDLDLSDAKTLLAEGRVEIVNAETGLASVMPALEEALAGNEPKEAFQKVREILSAVKQDIKDAHAKLVEAIRAIKASLPDISVDASVDVNSDNSSEAN
jgi:exonuclease VII small subunit